MKSIAVYCLILLSILKGSHVQEITSCVYIDYSQSYDVQLACDAEQHQDNCYHHMLTQEYRWGPWVKHLKTGDCHGNHLSTTISELFGNLEALDASNYGIELLSSSDLNFERLTSFNASHNKLTQLADSLFVHTTKIREIDFSFNKINAVSINDFKWATELERVLFSHNQISRLPAGIFIRTPSVIEIDFSFNKLSVLDVELFSDLSKLQALNFGNNLITTIGKKTFKSNPKLNNLNLENNPIKRMTFDIFAEKVKTVSIFVSPDSVTELDASEVIKEHSVVIGWSSDNFNFTIDKQEYGTMRFEGNLTDVTFLNVSRNQMIYTLDLLDQVTPSIETLDLSHNTIGEITADKFEQLANLKYLNLDRTDSASINSDAVPFLKNSTRLQELHLEDNPINRVDCNIFTSVENSAAVFISWENIKEIDTSCLGKTVKISFNQSDDVIFKMASNRSELRCTKENFGNLTNLSLSGNNLQNTPEIMRILGASIETLDVSSNFIGILTAETFQRFYNLIHLNLSRTNLSNFGFSTFYHQKKLQSLDVSFNHLHKIDFTLLLRNFKELMFLNLEGNDLTEIDSVNHSNFPQLNHLGLSKNNFSCHYLARFLRQWQYLELDYNPSQQTHIDGIDCIHRDNDTAIDAANTSTTNANISTLIGALNDVVQGHGSTNEHLLMEMCILKYLLILLCAISCAFLVMKSRVLQKAKEKIERNLIERSVIYRQNGQDDQGSLDV